MQTTSTYFRKLNKNPSYHAIMKTLLKLEQHHLKTNNLCHTVIIGSYFVKKCFNGYSYKDIKRIKLLTSIVALYIDELNKYRIDLI